MYIHIYSMGVAVDSGGGQQSTAYYMFPCSTVIQTIRPPLNLLQVLHQPSSNGQILLSSAGPGPRDGLGSVSASLDWLIGAIPVCAQVARGAVCFSGARVRNQIHPFQGVWERGRMEEEMKGEWKKRKMKNYLCPNAIL